ncbi:pyrroline-5-carboxylate reductase [Oricola thermophila]|uniref:Pyrroline-5-carboxylate reductase n=1 Tax=Oricola thermophila TaxID=2742145 RepID=A0A6N1VGW9_9HYPH|nr:pyrroline-5-carboxylate reductase [Oricola thermophila]QKV20028.1 pyrroline-5-carboxylate reductase [Oricola thermophila]
MDKNILLVGCGNMGFAMLQGWLSLDDAPRVRVVEPAQGLRGRLADLPVEVHAHPDEFPAGYEADIVVFAIKPQLFADVLPAYSSRVGEGAVFLSVAAGVTSEAIAALLGGKPAIVRCMPNTPAAIGQGVMAVYANARVTPEQIDAAKVLLGSCGMVVEVEEEGLMDAVTAVSGSGPAYVFNFIEALARAGEKAGLPADLSARMALKTVEGAARLATQAEDDPATLRRKVTSPGGTTAAALAVLMADDGLSPLLEKAVGAARDRSVELGRTN